MTAEQLMREESLQWLDRANRDIRAANVLIEAAAYAEALFHCQQAAEKALKGFLAYNDKPFRKTHDIGDLRAMCLLIDDSLQSVLADLHTLTQYAWRFRYPGAPQDPDPGDATDGLAKAELVLSEIRRRIGV
jgi:HEPN domain-containing protein